MNFIMGVRAALRRMRVGRMVVNVVALIIFVVILVVVIKGWRELGGGGTQLSFGAPMR